MLPEGAMFQVAYATAPNERRRIESFPTLDEARGRACALLSAHGDALAVDIRMDTMILIGAVEIREWCARYASP
jgi:hypothetical protein